MQSIDLAPPTIALDNTYARELEGLYTSWQPAAFPAPRLARFNVALATELGLDAAALAGDLGARVFSGAELPAGASTLAQAYAGHQFGGFSPQLGDGRALLVGEVIDRHGRRRDIAFKGSGRTPYSRGGDGKAALGPVLREYLIGEAMHALGIPTTRALAAVTTGETVRREQMLPGAILTRVAASHLRVGTFQYFASRDELEKLQRLADYAIRRHDPALVDDPDRYFLFLKSVAERQSSLIAQWMNVGFIHGVMNTDNMTISGETIDYGPCAFLEAYDPATVFSSIDRQGRYAFGNQPLIARWNLARLAETLLPLIDPEDSDRAVPRAVEIIDAFPKWFEARWLAGARAKLGLTTAHDDDLVLVADWLALLHEHKMDFTLAHRYLADAAASNDQPLSVLAGGLSVLRHWLNRWHARCEREPIDAATRAQSMRRVNPIYIPRNERVEEALAAATSSGDYAPFEALLAVIERPFEERAGLERYAEPAPVQVTANYQTFCGT